jgi:hypothetical protein
MQETAIRRALTELDRWHERRGELRAELEKVERQVAYYEALAKDMKRESRPSRVSDMLRVFFKA